MKKYIRRLTCITLMLFILFIAIVPSVAMERNAPYRIIMDEQYYPNDYIGYIYPDRPGTKEWQDFKNHQQMIDACQIRQDKLQSMSTKALIQSILAYPLIIDLFAYDDVSEGYSIVKQYFNGIQELEKRADAIESLIGIYTQYEPAKVLRAVKPDGRDKSAMLHVLVLSALIAQKPFSDKLSNSDMDVLSRQFKQGVEPTGIGETVRANKLDIKATPVSFYRYTTVPGSTRTVTTPRGSSVTVNYNNDCGEVWLYSDGNYYVRWIYEEIPSSYIATINSDFRAVYGISPIRNPTVKYNCHSYAWYNQSSTNKFWMNNPSRYLSDGSYNETGKLNVVVGGRIVYYKSTTGSYNTITHSSIITAIVDYPRSKREFTVRSKWGMAGLYEHSWANCPYYIERQFPVDLRYFN